ncbi:MAG: tetratricopeptide repeat protein, partial [Bacteroidia bacterium]
MKMKSHSVLTTVFIFAVFFFSSCKTQSPGNEMPITTSSKEALKFFIDGRDKFENIEFITAALLFDKAIQKDTNFAVAYLYGSLSEDVPDISRQNLAKAVSLIDKVSAGEKNEILYYLAQADDNGQKQKEYLDQLLFSFPSDKRVQMMAGQYYYDLGDYSTALIHYNKVTELDKDYASAYNRIGYCQSELIKYGEAEEAFLAY